MPKIMITMLTIKREICGYCGACVSVCPEGALELVDAYLTVDAHCTECRICTRACPLGALEVTDERPV
jgi:ferredoxin